MKIDWDDSVEIVKTDGTSGSMVVAASATVVDGATLHDADAAQAQSAPTAQTCRRMRVHNMIHFLRCFCIDPTRHVDEASLYQKITETVAIRLAAIRTNQSHSAKTALYQTTNDCSPRIYAKHKVQRDRVRSLKAYKTVSEESSIICIGSAPEKLFAFRNLAYSNVNIVRNNVGKWCRIRVHTERRVS